MHASKIWVAVSRRGRPYATHSIMLETIDGLLYD